MTIAEELSDYAHSLRYDDLNELVEVDAKKRLLDSLGCAIGAFEEAPIRAAKEVVRLRCAGNSATLLGTKLTSSPDMATFLNSAMVRYFDFNDTYLSKEPAHPSDNIPCCLAIAEMKHLSGRELLLAMVLAYEVQCRLCDAASIRQRGWDHVCYGLVSTAIASGKLLGLSVRHIENAVNISVNSHIAMRQVRVGQLSDWKGFSFANASRNAVFASFLAEAGITGPSPIFEGEMGFFRQVSGGFELDVHSFGGRKGSFKLPETYIKCFPAEYHSQTAIWAALEIRKEIHDPATIKSVEVETHEAGYTILGKDQEKWMPKTKETADHSLPYIVGIALLDGKVDNSSYSNSRLSDRNLLNLMRKTTVREDPELTRAYPAKIANRITVKMSDGRIVSRVEEVPKGHPKKPMAREEVEEKFRRLTKHLLGSRQTERIFDFVWNIEKQPDVCKLLPLCVVKS